MRTRVVALGAAALGVAIVVEVAGVLFANGIVEHNVYGFAGGILAVGGIIAISVGRVSKAAGFAAPPARLRSWAVSPVVSTSQEGSAFCRHCGSELAPAADFCRACGKPVT